MAKETKPPCYASTRVALNGGALTRVRFYAPEGASAVAHNDGLTPVVLIGGELRPGHGLLFEATSLGIGALPWPGGA